MEKKLKQQLRLGIIGFDTSHVTAFTQLLNNPETEFHVPGARVVAGYPSFSPDVFLSASRVEAFTAEMRDLGIEIVDSIEALLPLVDGILLESADGRRHLAEARPVIQARIPLFIDKPLAHNYADALAIAELAQEYDCPIFSSSALRFDENITALRSDSDIGAILGCDAFTPAPQEPSNPGLFWYGIHGVEMLYTFMGRGCESVLCQSVGNTDIVTGFWHGGRVATLRGFRQGAHDFGVTVFGEKNVGQARFSRQVPLYSNLLREVVPFLAGAKPPVVLEETLEIMAFMEVARESQQLGRPVELKSLERIS